MKLTESVAEHSAIFVSISEGDSKDNFAEELTIHGVNNLNGLSFQETYSMEAE